WGLRPARSTCSARRGARPCRTVCWASSSSRSGCSESGRRAIRRPPSLPPRLRRLQRPPQRRRPLPNRRPNSARYHRGMEKPLKIGVLAVQGNFREHEAVLRRLGAEPVEVRLPEQLAGLDGLIIPGGESTAIMRLMRLYGLDEALRRFDAPIFGTCAGMIVLDRDHLGLLDIRAERNAFGRQVKSFEADVDIGHGDEPVRAVFIRAPWIETDGPDVEVLAEVDGHPVLARQGTIRG